MRPNRGETAVPAAAATAWVIWLCACVRYWPDHGLVFQFVTCFYYCLRVDGRCKGRENTSVFENVWIRVDGASSVRLLVELYCGIVIKHVAFFAVCATLTIAVTLTSLLFELLLLCFRMWLWFQISKKIFADRRIWLKKGKDLQTPIHSPLHWIKFIMYRFRPA